MPEERKVGKHMTAVRGHDIPPPAKRRGPGGHTQYWRITHDREGIQVCCVAWHHHLKQYVTLHGPDHGPAAPILNNACHRDLTGFLEQLNREHAESTTEAQRTQR